MVVLSVFCFFCGSLIYFLFFFLVLFVADFCFLFRKVAFLWTIDETMLIYSRKLVFIACLSFIVVVVVDVVVVDVVVVVVVLLLSLLLLLLLFFF